MPFSITYQRPTNVYAKSFTGIFQTSDPQQTDWITPTGWDANAAKRAFEAQHPGCSVLRCDEITQ
jgi:hypothetical protein